MTAANHFMEPKDRAQKLKQEADELLDRSGIHIYRAVVEHGLFEFESITRYLRSQSINV